FDNDTICPPAPKGPYYTTQVDPAMSREWQFKNTSTDATHNNGFEWCINSPAIDAAGDAYANSEDGNLYVLKQGDTSIGSIFLNQALGAAYAPLSLDARGRILTENDGIPFTVGSDAISSRGDTTRASAARFSTTLATRVTVNKFDQSRSALIL